MATAEIVIPEPPLELLDEKCLENQASYACHRTVRIRSRAKFLQPDLLLKFQSLKSSKKPQSFNRAFRSIAAG